MARNRLHNRRCNRKGNIGENKKNGRENVIDIIRNKFALDTKETEEIVDLYFSNSNLYDNCYKF